MELPGLVALLESNTGHKATRSGAGYVCRCPAHEDQTASLSFSEGRKGLLLKCHAGCTFETIAAAIGVKPDELFYENGTAKNGKPTISQRMNIVETYPYQDAEGKLIFEVCRLDPKSFRQRRPDPAEPGNRLWNMEGVELLPYRLPELLTAVKAGETIFIAEGEKDVATLKANGFTATCNAAGAGKWRNDFAKYFDGARAVCIIADKDAPGRKHAVAIAANLRGKAKSVKVIELPDVAEHSVKDAHDFFAAGGTADKLREIAEAAHEFESPTEPTKTDNGDEPAERVTSAGLICVSDDAKISAVPLYYYADKSSWYAPDNRGGFFKASSAAALSFLADHGFSKAVKDSQGNSPAERAMLWKMQRNSVAYAGELAGCPAGCHKINGRLILVTHSPEMIIPQAGDFPTIARHIETMFADDIYRQAEFFYAWLASSYAALCERLQNPSGREFRHAPALYIAGERECGKSALIKLILQPLFGGRMADPMNYLREQKFNKDLFAAALLVLDDKGASSSLAERRQRGEAIKSLIWTDESRMEGKGVDALMLRPFRRLVIAGNDDEAGLQICPALSPSLVDKLLILRARRAEGLPVTNEEQDAWAKTIRAELPAFAHWLLRYQPSADFELSPRTRLPIFQHPGIVAALQDLQPEMRLLELIDAFDLIGQDAPLWEGTATDFQQAMLSRDKEGMLARLFPHGTSAGRMLAELARIVPLRVEKTNRGGLSLYRIFHPKRANPTESI